MKVHYNTKTIKGIKNPVVTVGTFDGVHFGHQKIINRLKSIASKNNGESVLLTFDPHPRKVLFNDNNLKLINTLDEKIEILKKLGLDHLVVQAFTKEFSQLSAKDYVEKLLINKLNTKTLVIGYDHHFGNDRKGNIDLLKNLQSTYQFNLEEIKAHEIDEIKISSTKIRQSIESGNVNLVYDFSGNYLQFSGKVIKGDGIGKTIEYPTANLDLINQDKILPAKGVYAINCKINEVRLRGVMNIGFRPTLNNDQRISIECHLLDWENDIYDQILHVDVIKRIRNEIKFPNIESLKVQIKKDIEVAKFIFNEM